MVNGEWDRGCHFRRMLNEAYLLFPVSETAAQTRRWEPPFMACEKERWRKITSKGADHQAKWDVFDWERIQRLFEETECSTEKVSQEQEWQESFEKYLEVTGSWNSCLCKECFPVLVLNSQEYQRSSSFCKTLKNKWYLAKVLPKRFLLNGHTIGFSWQIQRLELDYMSP